MGDYVMGKTYHLFDLERLFVIMFLSVVEKIKV